MSSRIIFIVGALSGLLGALLLPGAYSPAQAPPAESGPIVQVDERKLALTYVNAYRIHTTAAEMVFDLGFSMPDPNAEDPTSGELLFVVSNRIVMTYANAKEFRDSLDELISQYEEEFGEIRPQWRQ